MSSSSLAEMKLRILGSSSFSLIERYKEREKSSSPEITILRLISPRMNCNTLDIKNLVEESPNTQSLEEKSPLKPPRLPIFNWKGKSCHQDGWCRSMLQSRTWKKRSISKSRRKRLMLLKFNSTEHQMMENPNSQLILWSVVVFWVQQGLILILQGPRRHVQK